MADEAARARKAEEMLARLRLREQQRKAKGAEARQAAGAEDAGGRQKAEDFLTGWRAGQEAVAARIQALDTPCQSGGSQPAGAIQALFEELDSLDAEATQASGFLTTFHSTQLTAATKALRQQLAARQSAAQPRKRFTFAAAPAAAPAAERAQPPRPPLPGGFSPALAALLARPSEPVNTDRALKCLQGQRVVKGPRELEGKDFTLEGLTDCTVVLLGSLAALRAYNLTDCRVFVAAVRASSYIEGLRGCELALATGQLRVHDTHSTDFYLRVRSDPILEGCGSLRFAPLGAATAGQPALQPLLRAAGLAEESGQWRCIKDFAHPDLEQSPNWAMIPEAERKQHELPEELRLADG